MPTFERYADWYDLFYRDKDYEKEAEFVHERLRDAGADGGRLVDLGCGTGLHALAFASRGWSVEGIDLSPRMVTRAERRLAERPDLADKVSFIEGDIRSPSAISDADAVVSLFHVASYQTTRCELRQMFRGARQRLRAGGLFLFDYWYKPGVEAGGLAVRVKEVADAEVRVTRIASPSHRASDSAVDVQYTFFLQRLQTGAISRTDEVHTLRYWTEDEITQDVEAEDFSVIGTYAWMDTTSASTNSWAAYTVARAV